MAVEITVILDGRTILMDIEPNCLQGLKDEFSEFCKEDEAMLVRRQTYAPTYSMYTKNHILAEVKRKHVFTNGDRVYIKWTPLELHDDPGSSADTNTLENQPESRSTDLVQNDSPHSKSAGQEHRIESENESGHAGSLSEPESYGLVKEYFTEAQWAKMPSYLKLRQKNRLDLHEEKLKQGLVQGPFNPDEIDTSPPTKKCKLRKTGKGKKATKSRQKSSDSSFSFGDADSTSSSSHSQKQNNASSSKVLQLPNANQPGPSKAGGNFIETKELNKMKPHLPHYDIPKILQKKSENANDAMKEVIEELNTNGILTGKKRQQLIRLLTRHLYYKIAKSPRETTPDMKEGLAKSIVTYYPKFQCDRKENVPWKSLFERGAGRGWIANAARPMQKKYRTKASKPISQRGTEPSGETREENPDDVSQALALALIMPGRAEKSHILEGMKSTYPQRQAARKEQESVAEILRKFPHLASYDGEVLQEEYKRMRPEAHIMSLKLQQKALNILALGTPANVTLPLEDDTMRMLVIMSRRLPKDVRGRHEAKGKSTMADLHDIMEVVQLGCDIDQFVADKMKNATGSIQPYLVMVKSPMRNSIIKCFLILDEKPVQLPTTSTIKCLDYLLMTYFVFNVQYPLGWRATLHCLATCFANVFDDNKRSRPDTVTPSERDFMNLIQRS